MQQMLHVFHKYMTLHNTLLPQRHNNGQQSCLAANLTLSHVHFFSNEIRCFSGCRNTFHTDQKKSHLEAFYHPGKTCVHIWSQPKGHRRD